MVDSSCCLPAQTLKESGIIVVPHQLIADGRVYRDGIDLNTSDFYLMQSRNGSVITTSGPNPQAFLEAFRQAAKESQSILCITLSPRFSPVTYDSAKIAARLVLEERPDLEIHVLDSRAVAGSQGFVALEAHRASQKGLSLSETVARIEDLVPRLQLLAYLDTLKYLGRSGKITKAKAWAGTLLGFKPLVELSQGEATLIARPRSNTRAMERLLTIVSERTAGKPTHVNVMHANALERAQVLQRSGPESPWTAARFSSASSPRSWALTQARDSSESPTTRRTNNPPNNFPTDPPSPTTDISTTTHHPYTP